jgi:hypothetical protein
MVGKAGTATVILSAAKDHGSSSGLVKLQGSFAALRMTADGLTGHWDTAALEGHDSVKSSMAGCRRKPRVWMAS